MIIKASPPTLCFPRFASSTNSDLRFSEEGGGVICFPIISTTESHLHVYYHLYTDILYSMTHKIIALHMLNSIQI